MMYKVLLGSVRTDMKTFLVGEQVELSEKEGEALIREGVVELVVEQSQVPVAKTERPSNGTTRPLRKPRVEAKKEVEAKTLAEPSLDWTLSELVSYAEEREIEIPLEGSKEQILEAIKGGENK